MKRFPRILTFLAIQLVLLFLVVEVAVRVLRPTNDNLNILLYMPSVSSGFDEIQTLPELLDRTIVGSKPYQEFAGFVRNSRGFRTREYTDEKAPGTVRVLAIGDSFTFSSGGVPYSDGWQVLLENRLREGRSDDVELLSLGVPGVGPLWERRLWQIEGSRLNADVVLLVLFVGNDFTDHYDVEMRENVVTAAAQWSYTIRLIRNAARAQLARRDTEIEEFRTLESGDAPPPGGARGGYEIGEYRDIYPTLRPFMSRERLVEVESQRARLCERAQAEAFDELFERLTTVVADFRAEVEAAGVDFRVVVIPDRFQVNVEDRRAVLEHLGMTEASFVEWDMPQRRLNAFFEREGIAHLDLLPASLEATRNGQLYAPGNTHWGVRGNAFAAEQIAQWLAPALPAAAR